MVKKSTAKKKPTKKAPARKRAPAKKRSPAKPPAVTFQRVARISEFKMSHEASITGLVWLSADLLLAVAETEVAWWDVAREQCVHVERSDEIRHFAVSRDRTIGVSGSEEGVIRLWDLVARKELCVLGKHALGPDNERTYISAVALSADGTTAVSSGYDRTLRIWDLATRTLRHAVALPDMAYGCAISPDGTRAAAGGSDHTLRFVDTVRGTITKPCTKLEDFISSVSWSPDGRYVASTSDGPQAELWDAATGTLVTKWRVPGQTRECGFSDDSTQLWTTGGGMVSLYEVPTASALGELTSPNARWAAVAQDGRIAHGGGDGRILIGTPQLARLDVLHVVTKEESNRRQMKDALMSCAWSPDGTRVLAVAEDGKLGLFDAATKQRLWKTKEHVTARMFASAFAPSGTIVLTGDNAGEAQLWDVATGKKVKKLRGHELMINDAVFVDEKRVITIGDDRIVRWDLATGKPAAKSKEEQGGNACALSPDGKWLYAGGEDRVLRVHDPETLALVRTFEEAHTDSLRAIAVSPDGTRLVTGSVDQSLRVWDVASGTCLHECVAHQGPVRGVAFMHDGVRAISGSSDNTIRIWDTRTGSELAVLEGHRAFVAWLRLSPDGTRLASASGDTTVILWDLTDLPTTARKPTPDDTPLRAVAFNADGSRLYAGNEKGLVRVWDTATRTPLPPLRGGRFEVESLAVSPDGNHVATGVEQGVYLWTDGKVRRLTEDWGFKAVAFDADSSHLRAASRSFMTWSLPVAADAGPVVVEPKGSPESIAFTPDGQTACICDRTYLRVVNTATGKARFDQLDVRASARRVMVTGNTRALVVTDDGLIVVDLVEKKAGKTIPVEDAGDIVAMTVCGDHVVLAEWYVIRAVDLRTSRVVATLRMPSADRVRGVACAPDGTIALSTERGEVVLYRLV